MKNYIYMAAGLLVAMLAVSVCVLNKKMQVYKSKYEVARSNIVAYESDLKVEKEKSALYYFTIQDLRSTNDSLLKVSQEVQKQKNINTRKTDYIGYSVSDIHRTDTIEFTKNSNDTIVADSIIKDNVSIDTVITDKWYTLSMHVESPNLIAVSPKFTSERHVIIYTQKEYKNRRSKVFFVRWFQKKVNVAYVTLEEKNPYIDVKQQKLVKVIK